MGVISSVNLQSPFETLTEMKVMVECDLMCSGFWCPPGQRQAMALPCPRGHYCPQGSAAPQPCPSGNYQDLEKQAGCKVCQAGRSDCKEAYLGFITLFILFCGHLFSTG